MSVTRYRDLLWDLVSEPIRDEQAVYLRSYASEQDLFEARSRMETIRPESEGERLNLPLEQLTGASRRRIAGTAESPEIPGAQLHEIGRQLWEAIPMPAKAPLLEAAPDQPCRLKISSNQPALDDLPWEWLNDGGAPFALRPTVRIARSIPLRVPIPPLTIEPPVRVLLVSSVTPSEEVDVAQGLSVLRDPLAQPPYELTNISQPTPDELAKALYQGPNVVHFMGQAGLTDGVGSLILCDSQEQIYWLTGAELAQILPRSVRLVCLSPWLSGSGREIHGLSRLAQSQANQRLPTVVTSRYPVSESGTRAFWFAFYQGLAEHSGNANEAFHRAQQAVEASQGAASDWGGFSLVIRDQTAEVMSLRFDRPRSPERYAEEVQSQLAAELANDLATQVSAYGPAASETAVQHFKEQAKTASDLSEGLARLD